MKFRLSGLGLLVICAFAVHELLELVHSAASHSPTGLELLLALTVVVTGLGGVLMAAAGTELLRLPDDH